MIYNGCLLFLRGATIVLFADDLAVVATAKHPEDIEVYAAETMRVVKFWLERGRLPFTNKKT